MLTRRTILSLLPAFMAAPLAAPFGRVIESPEEAHERLSCENFDIREFHRQLLTMCNEGRNHIISWAHIQYLLFGAALENVPIDDVLVQRKRETQGRSLLGHEIGIVVPPDFVVNVDPKDLARYPGKRVKAFIFGHFDPPFHPGYFEIG